MKRSTVPTCHRCGRELVLEIEETGPSGPGTGPLLADPPVHLVCVSAGCRLPDDV